VPTSPPRPGRTPARARRALLRLLAAGAATTVLGACAAGLDAQTVQVYNAPAGADLRSDGVDALGTVVVVGPDGTGTLSSGLVTPFDTADALVGVEATDSGGDPLTTQIAGGTLPIPAEELVQTADGAAVTISGGDLEPGRLVRLVMSFERSGQVSGDVPVVAREQEYASVPTPAPRTSRRPAPQG